MRNAGLDELQAGITIGRRNINNLRYADDTTLMAENKEELRSLLMRVKEESERAGLKLKKKLRSWHLSPFSSVQFSRSVVSDSFRPHGLQHARPPCPSPTLSLPKLMSIESVMPSNHLILCCPLLLLPSIFLSFRVFSNESALHIRWPKFWSFSFSISPSNEHPGLISFRMDWLDLLAA